MLVSKVNNIYIILYAINGNLLMETEYLNILTKLSTHFGAAPSLIWDPHNNSPAAGCAYFAADETKRPWGTLATFGMSLMPMIMDHRAEVFDTRRTGVIAYVNKDEISLDDIANWMRWAGVFPFVQEPPTCLGMGHTIRMGNLFDHSSLTTLFMLKPIVNVDQKPIFVVENEEVSFLWLTFLTDAEYSMKKEQGVNSILDLFETHNHPLTLDRSRKSYV